MLNHTSKLLKKYASLSKKLLNSLEDYGEDVGKLISNKYNAKSSECQGFGCHEGDRLFFIFFREWINLLIGVKLLYSNNLMNISIPTIRSLYEIFLQIVYLLMDKQTFEEKGKCYFLCNSWKNWKVSEKNKTFYAQFFRKKMANEKVNSLEIQYNELSKQEGYNIYAKSIKKISKNHEYFNAEWYKVYEYTVNPSNGRFSLAKITKVVKEKFSNDPSIQNMFYFFYHNLYDIMSQQAHGIVLADRLITLHDGRSFFKPVNYPGFETTYLEFINIMFIAMIIKIRDMYFYGDEEMWNSSSCIDIQKLNNKNNEIIEKLRKIECELADYLE